jgi:hypothetical protein
MTKYRIVKRNNNEIYCYFAQKKVLWWWVDLPQCSYSGWKDRPPCETPSHSQELVESYIECMIFKNKDEVVVKVYE